MVSRRLLSSFEIKRFTSQNVRSTQFSKRTAHHVRITHTFAIFMKFTDANNVSENFVENFNSTMFFGVPSM